MEEIWKPINDYPGYEISNLGRVKSYKMDKINGKIMNPYKTTKGYLQIDISLDGRARKKSSPSGNSSSCRNCISPKSK